MQYILGSITVFVDIKEMSQPKFNQYIANIINKRLDQKRVLPKMIMSIYFDITLKRNSY